MIIGTDDSSILQTPFVAELPSFGSEQDGKAIRKASVTLEGTANGSSWSTIPADQFYLRNKTGFVQMRTEDDSGNDVDWSSFTDWQDLGNTAFRITYTVRDSGTNTTYTNEAITFSEVDPYLSYSNDGSLGGELIQNIYAHEIHAEVGWLGGWTIAANSISSDSGNATIDSATPYLGLGTQTYNSGSGFWVGKDSGTYKLFVGNSAANKLVWDGSTLAITGNVTASAGEISGNLLVSGTLQSSATANLGYKLSSTGLRTWNASNVQTAEINSNGSGWLGTSSVFSWNTSGVLTLNGSVVVGNTIDAGKISFSAPTISGLTLTNNSPSAGYVAWSSFILTYQGVSYTVAAGNSNLKFIYWKKATSTTVLQASATIPTNAPDMFMMCVNFSGTAYQSNFAPFIYADYLSVGSLSAVSADLGTITAGSVTGVTFATTSGGSVSAGGGNALLDSNGLTFASGTAATNSLKWKDTNIVRAQIYGNFASNTTTWAFDCDPSQVASESQININSSTSSGSGRGLINLFARAYNFEEVGNPLGLVGAFYTQVSDVTVSNTVVQTSLLSSAPNMQANTLVDGRTIRITAQGYYSTTGTPTLKFEVLIGGITVCATNNVTCPNNASNRGWSVIATVTCRSTGSSGSVYAQGTCAVVTAGGDGQLWDMSATSTVTTNTTVARTADLRATWGTASSSNTITCTNAIVEIVN